MTKPENKNVTVGDLLSQGAEDFQPEDLQAPQIILTQAMSDLVTDGTLKPGQIVRGTEVLGDKEKRVVIIPLTYTKKYILSEHKDGGGRGQFRGLLVQGPGLDDAKLPEMEKTGTLLPLEFNVEGVSHKRTKLLELFCLLKSDLESSQVVPCVLWLRGGAFNRVGKGVMSHFAFSRANRVVPQHTLLSLGCHTRKNEMGTWFEFDVRPVKDKVDVNYHNIIENWYGLIRSNKVAAQVVDDAPNTDVTNKSKF